MKNFLKCEVAIIKIAFAFGALFFLTDLSAQAEPQPLPDLGPSLDVLTPDQQELAKRFTAFVAQMEEKEFARIATLNGGSQYEDRQDETPYDIFHSRVTRGSVVEKAGGRLAFNVKTPPNARSGEIIWGRGYLLNIHPKTPLVGRLHAVIVLQFYKDGSSAAAGWLGVMPGTKVEEDLAELKASMDAVFAQHGKSADLFRELICNGDETTVADFRRKPACVGASFYGPPVYRESTEKSFEFIAQAFDSFTDTYFNLIEKRQDDSFTQDDELAKYRMRKEDIVDALFSDPYSSSGVVPFRIWSFTGLPPEIRF
jgi:coproporphyrinogen III oxidase